MDNWITLSTLSGDSGTTIVTITAATQQELIERATSFTVKTNYTNLQQTVEVEQLMYLGLRFNITNGGNIYWKGNGKTIQYSKNGGEWISITSTTGSGVDIPVQSGDILFFKGNNDVYQYSSFSASTGTNFKVSGNIMSLIDSTNYENLTTLSSANTFWGLFENCSGLTDASELLLPATTLANWCYVSMFANCNSLTSIPALPATTLAQGCYQSMFYGCTNLTDASNLELPATTLTPSCYSNMFNSCSNLTTAPELPATTLASECYASMFSDCSSLTTAPELPATTLAESCYEGMFFRCVKLEVAPTLPAPTLTTNCYLSMFSKCSNLNLIKCMATDISATNCTYQWVYDVAPTGTFYKPEEMEDWLIDNVNGIPIGWTIHNSSFDYFTMEIVSGTRLLWTCGKIDVDAKVIQYSINDGDWISVASSQWGTEINFQPGDVIRFKGNNTAYASDINLESFNGCNYFQRKPYGDTGVTVYMYGNIMSLVYGDDFIGKDTLTAPATFRYMFGVSDNYFQRLTHPTKNISLPATTLTPHCYWGMFQGCHITTAPTLPAPIIPRTNNAYGSYAWMFNGCSRLNYIKCLAENPVYSPGISECTSYKWLSGVSPDGIFIKKTGVGWNNSFHTAASYESLIPNGWTVQDA